MIQSLLNPKINYKKTKKMLPIDIGQSLNIYEYEVFEDTPPIMVAVGIPHKNPKDNTVINHYLYATLDPEQQGFFQRTIGIIEIRKNEYSKFLDAEKDLDLDKTKPLLFIDESELLNILEKQQGLSSQKNSPVEIPITDLSKEEEEENTEEKSLLEPTPATAVKDTDKNPLLEGKLNVSKGSQHVETKEEAQQLIEEYKKQSGGHEWIQERMKNAHYSVVSVPKDGDCFFHVIIEAFTSVGIQTTVRGLRDFLSKHHSVEKTFKQEQQIYSEFGSYAAVLKNNNTAILSRVEEIATLLRTPLTEPEKNTLTEEKRDLLAKKRRNDEKIKDIEDDIEEIVPHMKKIKTEREYREHIKTSDFWANEWAIEILEKKLQVKFILFPKDDEAIYTVGTLNKPNRYILAAFVSGNHYELIQYNQTRLFLSFDALPYSVKCLGVKYKFKIPDFKNFHCEVVGGGEIEDENTDEDEPTGEIFILSAKAKPHHFKKEKMAQYFELRRKQNRGWERILSDDFIVRHPLIIDGNKWNSVSHYVLAGHFHSNSSFYKNFTADSNTLISNDVEIAQKAVKHPGNYTQKNRKSGQGSRKATDNNKTPMAFYDFMKNILFTPIENVQRDTLTEERIQKRRKTAWTVKLQNPVIKHLLVLTRDAKLYQNNMETEDTLLENLRDKQNVPI